LKVAERIHQISTPTPFYVGPINAYLIKDEPLTLVDSAIKTEEGEKALRAGLAELGLGFGDIEQLVVTHSHLEHYGLMATIAAEGRPRVYAHPLEVYDLESERGYASPDDKRNERVEKFLLESGLPKDKLELLLMRHPIFEQLRDPITVTDPVEDGQRLKLGHMELTVIHCPGHSPGMINLYDPAANVLLSGDNILKHISPVPLLSFPQDASEPRAHSLADYLATLQRLRKLDIDLVLTGHGETQGDHRQRYRAPRRPQAQSAQVSQRRPAYGLRRLHASVSQDGAAPSVPGDVRGGRPSRYPRDGRRRRSGEKRRGNSLYFKGLVVRAVREPPLLP